MDHKAKFLLRNLLYFKPVSLFFYVSFLKYKNEKKKYIQYIQ